MRKVLGVLLALLFLLPAAAFANTITVNLEEATLEELQTAQAAIQERMDVLLADQPGQGDVICLTGTGTTILKDVNILFYPARMHILSENRMTVTLTGGPYEMAYYIEYSPAVRVLTFGGTFTLLIEAEGDWTIEFSPIEEGGYCEAAGSGAYVGDFFELTEPMVFTASFDGANLPAGVYDYMELNFFKQFEYGDEWGYDNPFYDDLETGEFVSKDFIVKPTTGHKRYFWQVVCNPYVTWTIRPKK